MDKLFVIFNPAARGEKNQRVRKFLEAKDGHSITLAPTERAGDAKLLAVRAVQEGYRIIVAAGLLTGYVSALGYTKVFAMGYAQAASKID